MATVTQNDLNQIVAIQVRITPQIHLMNAVTAAQVRQWLIELPYMSTLTDEQLNPYIIMAPKQPSGIDTLALLQRQYDVADPAQLIFNNLKLGAVLLKDAHGVTFDHCDFTYCPQLNATIPAFIKTHYNMMNNFTRARFIACDLHEVLFKNVFLNQAYFAGSKLSATQFLSCDLANCEFESISFSRMPRFVHSNLYHSHAHLHSQDHNRASHFYDKTALLGGTLISASALMVALMMFDVFIPSKMFTVLTVSLLGAGVILAYLGATSSFRQQNMAHHYELFEHAVDANALMNRQVKIEENLSISK